MLMKARGFTCLISSQFVIDDDDEVEEEEDDEDDDDKKSKIISNNSSERVAICWQASLCAFVWLHFVNSVLCSG